MGKTIVIVGVALGLFMIYQFIYYSYRKSEFKDKSIGKNKEYLKFELEGMMELKNIVTQ